MIEIIDLSNHYYNKALDCINKNKISEAISILAKSLNLYADNTDALNLMGLSYYKLCQFHKAYFYWDRSIEVREEDNCAVNYLNDLKGSSFESFLEEYNKAIEYLHSEDYIEAISILNRIIELNDELIEPYIIRGLCNIMLENYQQGKADIEHALSLDVGNVNYLNYLNEANKLSISLSKEPGKYKYMKVASGVLLILLVLISSMFYKNSLDNKELFSTYNNEINDLTSQLSIAMDSNKSLKEDLDSKIQNLNQDVDIALTEEEDFAIELLNEEHEKEIFNTAIEDYKGAFYEDSIIKFKSIYDRGIAENLVAESNYFLASSYERTENIIKAKEYYIKYIEDYKGENYYDDSLYNLALMLYRTGDIDASKGALSTLVKEIPNSIFNNSKTRYILNK